MLRASASLLICGAMCLGSCGGSAGEDEPPADESPEPKASNSDGETRTSDDGGRAPASAGGSAPRVEPSDPRFGGEDRHRWVFFYLIHGFPKNQILGDEEGRIMYHVRVQNPVTGEELVRLFGSPDEIVKGQTKRHFIDDVEGDLWRYGRMRLMIRDGKVGAIWLRDTGLLLPPSNFRKLRKQYSLEDADKP